MIFAHPHMLWLLAAVAVLLIGFIAAQRRKALLLRTLGDEKVLRKLVEPYTFRHQAVKGILQVAALALLVVALAGPRWGQRYQEVRRKGVDVIIAVDVSLSMLAEDIKPNRLTQARRELGLLINRLEGDRVGLVVFAGSAFLQCPLTLDYGAVRSLLDLVHPGQIPTSGTNLAAALGAASEAFADTDRNHKAVILLTDGEDHSEELPAAVKRAKAEGVRILAIGFGSPEGDIIPLRTDDGRLKEYKADKAGQTVVTKLDEEALQNMTRQTGGRYYRATQGEIEIERIAADLKSMDQKTLESRVYGRYQDRYQWPLTLVLLLLLLEFLWPEAPSHLARFTRRRRRGAALAAAALLFGVTLAEAAPGPGGPPPEPSRRVRRYQKKAEKNPLDPKIQYNLGDALYRDGDFAGAAAAYERAESGSATDELRAKSAYNSGNALFRQGKLKPALEKYKQALRLNPNDMDAKHNLEFTLRVLEAQPQQQQSQEGDEDGEENDQQAQASPGEGDGEEEKREAPKEGAMSREDAERLLQAVEDQEKKAREKMRQAAPGEAPKREDW